nr:MAG TPA: hypothetical protein [Caudoviricetes sp.]
MKKPLYGHSRKSGCIKAHIGGYTEGAYRGLIQGAYIGAYRGGLIWRPISGTRTVPGAER